MEQLRLGLCGTSRKENEYRLPVHPLQLDRIEPGLRARIFRRVPAHPDVNPATGTLIGMSRAVEG